MAMTTTPLRVWVGETVRVRVRFTTDDGEPMAATGVTITAKDPNGSLVDGAVIGDLDVGAFHADISAGVAGTWFVRAACASPVGAVEEDRFVVQPSYVVA